MEKKSKANIIKRSVHFTQSFVVIQHPCLLLIHYKCLTTSKDLHNTIMFISFYIYLYLHLFYLSLIFKNNLQTIAKNVL